VAGSRSVATEDAARLPWPLARPADGQWAQMALRLEHAARRRPADPPATTFLAPQGLASRSWRAAHWDAAGRQGVRGQLSWPVNFRVDRPGSDLALRARAEAWLAVERPRREGVGACRAEALTADCVRAEGWPVGPARAAAMLGLLRLRVAPWAPAVESRWLCGPPRPASWARRTRSQDSERSPALPRYLPPVCC